MSAQYRLMGCKSKCILVKTSPNWSKLPQTLNKDWSNRPNFQSGFFEEICILTNLKENIVFKGLIWENHYNVKQLYQDNANLCL